MQGVVHVPNLTKKPLRRHIPVVTRQMHDGEVETVMASSSLSSGLPADRLPGMGLDARLLLAGRLSLLGGWFALRSSMRVPGEPRCRKERS